MFICNECAEDTVDYCIYALAVSSYGPCEICNKKNMCKDVHEDSVPDFEGE